MEGFQVVLLSFTFLLAQGEEGGGLRGPGLPRPGHRGRPLPQGGHRHAQLCSIQGVTKWNVCN